MKKFIKLLNDLSMAVSQLGFIVFSIIGIIKMICEAI